MDNTLEKKLWLKKAAAITVLPFAALAFTGCGGEDTAGPEESVAADDVAQPEDTEVEGEGAAEEGVGAEGAEGAEGELAYDGVYDQAFVDESTSLVGQEVTVSAEVNELISDNAFTIAGTEDTDVQPILVVQSSGNPEIQQGLAVAVTGTVRDAFVVTDVESELGIELEDEAYAEWENQRYIVANSVDTSVDADASEDQEEGEV